MEDGHQRAPLLLGDGVDLHAGVDARKLHHGLDGLHREEVREGVDEVLVGVLLEVGQDAGIQLGIIQSGLEVDVQLILPRFHVGNVGGGREDQGARHTVVGEEHLPEVLVNELVFCGVLHAKADVAEGQTHHAPAEVALADQGHQGCLGGDDGMPQRLGQLVAVSVGARHGVGAATRAENGCGHGDILPAYADRGNGGLAVHRVGVNRGHAALEGLDPQLAAVLDQCLHHVSRLVRHGEHPLAPLHLEGDAQGLKVVLGVLGIKARQGGVEESGVGGDVGQKLVAVAVVGEVAPSLARDAELLAHAVVLLDEQDLVGVGVANLGGVGGGHEARGTASDDGDYVFLIHSRQP